MTLILAGLCTISVLLFKMSADGQKKLQSIQKERTVINDVSNLLSLSDEMAISSRGYFIVREKDFLAIYQQTRTGLIVQNKLLSNYAKQSRISDTFANSISLLVNNRIRVSDSIIQYVNGREKSIDVIQAYVKEGTKYSNNLRKAVREFVVERLQYVHEMEQKAAADNRKYLVLFIVNIISLVLVVVIGVIYIYISLRAKSKAEKILQSYRQSNLFLNSLSEGVVVQNNKGYILECNTAAEKILGLTVDQMQGKSSLDPLWRTVYEDGSNFPGELHPAMQALATGESQENVIMGVYKPQGEVTWISINSHPVYAEKDGTVLSVVSSFTDITERKIAEEILVLNEKRLRLALDKTGDNAWEHNFETGITWFSAANNHLLGYTADELNEKKYGNRWWNNTHPDDKHILIKNDKEYKSGARENHSVEYRIYHKDGSMKWVLDRGVVIERTENGKPIRIVGTHTDITKEKEQQELIVKHEQTQKREIIAAVIQAQENEREQIANELHEGVAQALSSIKMLLEIAKTDPTSIGLKISLAQENLTGIINEVRLISQNINTSTLKMMGLKNTIEDVIESAREKSRIKFTLNTIHFNENLAIDFPVQLAVLRMLQEAIKNIIRHSNATEAQIELHSSKSLIQLFTRDNGHGFDQKQGIEGLGFKTIISRAEQYGGNVEIVSAPGKGCLLQIILPSSVK